jgi:hypothetical protein
MFVPGDESGVLPLVLRSRSCALLPIFQPVFIPAVFILCCHGVLTLWLLVNSSEKNNLDIYFKIFVWTWDSDFAYISCRGQGEGFGTRDIDLLTCRPKMAGSCDDPFLLTFRVYPEHMQMGDHNRGHCAEFCCDVLQSAIRNVRA